MIKEDDLVLCEVIKIEGTAVFCRIDGEEKQGTIVMSEVAAGRIRNLRDYVSAGRRIVCKILKIYSDHVELSFRRVTTKERDRILEAYKKEKALVNVLKIAGEDAEKVVSKMRAEYSVADFFDELESNPDLLKEFVNSELSEKIAQMFFEKSIKEKKVERKFYLRSDASDGLSKVKEILEIEDAEVHYLGSGFFSIAAKSSDFKSAATKVDGFLKEIEFRAKKFGAFFEVKKEK